MGAGAMKAWFMRVLSVVWRGQLCAIVGRSIEARGQVCVKLCPTPFPLAHDPGIHACVHTWAREAKSAASTRATRRRNRAILWQMTAVGEGVAGFVGWVGQSSGLIDWAARRAASAWSSCCPSPRGESLRAIHHPKPSDR